jgi:hypothetical protein
MGKQKTTEITKTVDSSGIKDFWELLGLKSGVQIRLQGFLIILSYLKKVTVPVFQSRQ